MQHKAQELCAAIQMRGWANTQLSRNQHEDIVLNSRTGCRAWNGTKWGFISTNTPNNLNIVIDVPKARVLAESIAEKLGMQILTEEEPGKSGVRLENKADRDTIHISLNKEALTNVVFNDSALIEVLSDLRRWNCL